MRNKNILSRLVEGKNEKITNISNKQSDITIGPIHIRNMRILYTTLCQFDKSHEIGNVLQNKTYQD